MDSFTIVIAFCENIVTVIFHYCDTHIHTAHNQTYTTLNRHRHWQTHTHRQTHWHTDTHTHTTLTHTHWQTHNTHTTLTHTHTFTHTDSHTVLEFVHTHTHTNDTHTTLTNTDTHGHHQVCVHSTWMNVKVCPNTPRSHNLVVHFTTTVANSVVMTCPETLTHTKVLVWNS